MNQIGRKSPENQIHHRKSPRDMQTKTETQKNGGADGVE